MKSPATGKRNDGAPAPGRSAPLMINIPTQVAKAYLVNVAETINNVLMPRLEGHARARAFDCLRVVSRLASDMEPSGKSLQLLPIDAGDAVAEALGEAAAIENVNEEGLLHLQSIMAAPPAAARKFDHIALEAYLRKHPLGGEDLRISESMLLAGGRSKITILVTQQGARGLPEHCIVRQDWANSVTGKSVTCEFKLLKRLHREGIRVPEPLLLETSAEVVGSPFIITSRQTGAPSGDGFFALPESEPPVMQMVEQLGRVHAIKAEEFEGMEGIVETNFTAAQLRDNLAVYAGTIAKLDTVKSPLVEQAIQWLERNADFVATGQRTLVHGDVGFHNSLIDGDELSVVLDWEMAHIGNPAYDLGYLRNAVTDDAMWSKFMQYYKAAGGPDIDPAFIDYYTLFSCMWFHQIQLQARTALCMGVVHDIEIAAVCAHIAPQSLASIARTLRRVMR